MSEFLARPLAFLREFSLGLDTCETAESWFMARHLTSFASISTSSDGCVGLTDRRVFRKRLGLCGAGGGFSYKSSLADVGMETEDTYRVTQRLHGIIGGRQEKRLLGEGLIL